MNSEVNFRQVKHLYFRAGFGPELEGWKRESGMPVKKLARKLMERSQAYFPLTVGEDPAELPMGNIRMMNEAEKKLLRQQGRKSIKKLNAAWINRMAQSPAQLREKMTFFWHDHFACRLPLQARITQRQNNLLRKHALGKFGDLLRAISKDAGMLRFLNNQQNRKDHPNENFAREVMELFTLGRGHYTEQDIKEGARAFTGWSSNAKGEFVFRKYWHDEGEKQFLGRKGNFDGDDILNILLEEKQTARYLTTKLYRFFVNPEVNEAVVQEWADLFYRSDYDISLLLETILTSDHFYEERNMGARVKSPVEYLVSLMRLLQLEFEDEDGPILIQKALGQMLFSPPSVAGWPDDKSWIDSSSIMARMKIPEALIYSSEIALNPKSDFAGNEDIIKTVGKRQLRRLRAEINWKALLRQFGKYKREQLLTELGAYFLQVQSPHLTQSGLFEFVQEGERSDQLKAVSMRLLCTPEFQLC